MPRLARGAAVLAGAAFMLPVSAWAQAITALPDQVSTIRLSNRDVNHVVCVGGEIEDVKFSAEKAIAVERAGSDAWIKFLVKEVDDMGMVTRSYVTTPSEFFISCNGAIYPLYAEPADIPAQTVTLAPGRRSARRPMKSCWVRSSRRSVRFRSRSRCCVIACRRVSPRLRPVRAALTIAALPSIRLIERRRLTIEGAGLSASEYRLESDSEAALEERQFLDRALGADIFAVTLDRLQVKPGEGARVIVIRRGDGE